MVLTEEQQKVALNALATTLGKPVSEIESTLTGDSPTDVDVLLSTRIKAIRKEGEDLGHGKIQKFADKKAKELFGEGVTADSMEGLLTKIKETYQPAIDPLKLTEEQVKMHPTFRALETTLQTKDAEHQKALEIAKAEGLANAQKGELKAQAIKARVDNGAVISDDPNIAAAQEFLYLQKLEGVEIKTVDGKKEYWRDGHRVENDKGFPLTEADFFKDLVGSSYTTKVSDQKTSSGLKQTDGTSGSGQNGQMTHYKGELPKTQDDLNKILLDKTLTREARNEARAYFENQQKAA